MLNTETSSTAAIARRATAPRWPRPSRRSAPASAFIVVVNHLKSKGSACDAARCRRRPGQLQRRAHATPRQALTAWLAGNPTGTGDPDVLIMGDLNAYAKEDPIDGAQERRVYQPIGAA